MITKDKIEVFEQEDADTGQISYGIINRANSFLLGPFDSIARLVEEADKKLRGFFDYHNFEHEQFIIEDGKILTRRALSNPIEFTLEIAAGGKSLPEGSKYRWNMHGIWQVPR